MESIDASIGRRVRQARLAQGLSLDALAEKSGVSRAMISRIERAQTQATAALLGRLCAGLGADLGWLFQAEADPPRALARRDEQPTWRDPESGYVRRNLTPAGARSPVRLVEVELPAGARVSFEAFETRRIDQHIFMLDGAIERRVGDQVWRIAAGDCLHVALDQPSSFYNPGPTAARYVVALALLETP
jgi:transcriptional regulator with XRE-family HTH domain